MSALLADIDATCASLGYYDGTTYHPESDSLQGLKVRSTYKNISHNKHLLISIFFPNPLRTAFNMDFTSWWWSARISTIFGPWKSPANRSVANGYASHGRRWFVWRFTSIAGQFDESGAAAVPWGAAKRWTGTPQLLGTHRNFARIQTGIFVATCLGNAWQAAANCIGNCKFLFFGQIFFNTCDGKI